MTKVTTLNNRSYLRLRLKCWFILIHLDIFKTHEKEKILYPERFKIGNPRSVNDKMIVDLSRNQIGWSQKTIDADISTTLNGLYKEIMDLPNARPNVRMVIKELRDLKSS